LTFTLILAFALSAGAQNDYPKVEVFAGYSLGALDVGGLFNDDAHGVGGSVTYNFTKYFGLTADVASQFGEKDRGFLGSGPGQDFNSQQFLFGPRFSLRGKRVTAFAHALFGGARTHVDGFTDAISGFTIPSQSSTDFTMGYGVGLDVNLNSRLAVRPLQLDYIPVFGDSTTNHNARHQAGIVLRFGH
jgi:hypothetical protein